ncbi:MAG: hypothetical protein JNK30_14860 [Phenylobacterium sp.]|uniref:hypothetical protein n=1 Tax=Phenylobacterium sp. TaxID=1871053 RepID=UPI001A461A1F|nr:hypothetical protein [Phenylobacterium sp.]MBL8772661.1 hypothetical protein [Phenylobacterium sp.]
MKTLILPLAVATALTAGAATAQPYGWGSARSIDERQDMLMHRIDRGEATGQLTRREAYRLKMEFNAIARLEARYRYNGLSRWEANDLMQRLDNLQHSVRMARRDDDRRRYGYNDQRPMY